MAKIRVHELAKELERDNKEIIAALQKLGVEVKSHMSNVEDAEAGKIRGMFAKKTARPKEEEQMQQNPEKDLEKKVGKTPEAEGSVEAPPKKKNIIQVPHRSRQRREALQRRRKRKILFRYSARRTVRPV